MLENPPSPQTDKEPFRERISVDFLFEVFSSEKFQQALQKAAQTTARTGHETEFRVWIDKSHQFFITGVLKGSSDQVGSLDSTDEILEIDGPIGHNFSGHLANLLELHFHPDEIITPSPEDLSAYGSLHKISETPTIDIIASISRTKGLIKALCLKKPPFPLLEEDIEAYATQTRGSLVSFRTVLQLLEELNLEALTLFFEKKETDQGLSFSLTEASQQDLLKQETISLDYKYIDPEDPFR